MDNKFYITFDKSNEDIPTLVVFTETSYFALGGPTMTVHNIITGDEAVKIWDRLSKKSNKEMLEVKESDGECVRMPVNFTL